MAARARPRMLGPLKWLTVLWMLCAASLAGAAQVQLRDSMREARPPIAAPDATHPGKWTWFALDDAAALRAMPDRWTLLVDQVRFEDIRLVVTGRDGRVQDVTLGADHLQDNWAAGGVLTFDITVPGPQVRSLSLGFNRLDSPSLIRKVTAATPYQAAENEAHWLMLMGIFAGLLVSGFVYNLFVHAGQHQPFQRWYLGWVVASLAYGLTWSNLAAHVFPALAGPLAVRIDTVLVGLTVALGSVFLPSVLEAGKVPRRLRRAIVALAVASVGSGIVAADERLLAAGTTDLVLNLCLLASVGTSLVAIFVAISRGSRVIWLYLIGWSPVIAVYGARAARNFGLVGQSDAVDLATFAAIGFESLVFSLIIADRFRAMRRERDAAAASARALQVEQEALRRAARTDFLTGLGNRAAFHENLRELYARKTRLALFLIDVDHLKEINDRQGHDAGDALLQRMGEVLAALAGPATNCARIGGDEFAIVIEDASTEKERIASALDRLQGTAWTRDNWSGVMSLSIGMARSDGASSPADLFQQADIALYEAKKLGRGRRQAFDSHLRQQIQGKLDLIKDAHGALRRSEFKLHFQPIVDLRTGKPAGVEALVRWQHPRMGLLTPERFECVLADEEIGQAVQQRVLELAFDQLRGKPDLGGTLAVNFTAMDLNGPPAAFRLLRKLAAAGVAPSALCVEVTEGTLLGKPGDPATALQLLHQAGVRIALDDFGTGYASLVHLKEIPVDTLKIDRSFVSGLLDGDESEEIVRAVLALGHGLKKTVIAEGVETAEQLARLRELGCDFAQGYLFGRPSPVFDWQTTYQAAA